MDDFVSISAAARIAGVPRSTIYRRIADGSLRTWRSPLRRDVRLVRRADLLALLVPVPFEDASKKAAA